MRYKFQRVGTLVDRYGLRKGLALYLSMRSKSRSVFRVPGIVFPFKLRRGSSDDAVFDQVFIRGDYDIDFPFQPKLIVDAGAHIGLFSILMKSRFPESRLIAIEPDEENYAMLQSNLADYANCTTVRAGLWHAETRLSVQDEKERGQSSFSLMEDTVRGNITGLGIDQLMKRYGIETIDVLKIDIEAAERFVFEKNYENWLRRCRMLIIELHDWMVPGSSRNFFRAVHEVLDNYDYLLCGENTIIINRSLPIH